MTANLDLAKGTTSHHLRINSKLLAGLMAQSATKVKSQSVAKLNICAAINKNIQMINLYRIHANHKFVLPPFESES